MTLHVHRPRPTKEKEWYDLLQLIVPHGLIKGLHKEVDYRHQPHINEKWVVQAAQCSRGMEWKVDTYEY